MLLGTFSSSVNVASQWASIFGLGFSFLSFCAAYETVRRLTGAEQLIQRQKLQKNIMAQLEGIQQLVEPSQIDLPMSSSEVEMVQKLLTDVQNYVFDRPSGRWNRFWQKLEKLMLLPPGKDYSIAKQVVVEMHSQLNGSKNRRIIVVDADKLQSQLFSTYI